MPFFTSFSAPCVTQDELAHELASLSQEEAQAALRDLYGNQKPIRETEEFIHEKLELLDKELEVLPNSENFDMAQLLCPTHANCRSFRLRFLRADGFNVNSAAQRIINYWNEKVLLFGVESAFRKLTLEDFSGKDDLALTGGGFTMLPETDKTGRGVFVSNRSCWDYRRTYMKSNAKVLWYLLEQGLEDESVQRNGIVFLDVMRTGTDYFTKYNAKLDRLLLRLLRTALPIKLTSIHHFVQFRLCTNLIVPHFLYFIGRDLRTRYRLYEAENLEENIMELETYGLDSNILPPVIGGTADFHIRFWLDSQRERGL